MRTPVICCLAAAALALGACGKDKDEKLPPACLEGPAAVVQALGRAPAAVTLKGTPISHCFNRGARGDDIQVVGTILLAAAQQLDDNAAQGQPGAALKLGYLVGAAERGADRNGLADELIRRLQAEQSGIRGHRTEYLRGVRAGLARG